MPACFEAGQAIVPELFAAPTLTAKSIGDLQRHPLATNHCGLEPNRKPRKRGYSFDVIFFSAFSMIGNVGRLSAAHHLDPDYRTAIYLASPCAQRRFKGRSSRIKGN